METGSTHPSYSGPAGTTRTAKVHVSCPDGRVISAVAYRSVDVSQDPELGQKLLSEDPAQRLNAVTPPGGVKPICIDRPVVYHDPENRLFVLVLPEGMRFRELAERARLLAELADDTEHDVPAYVRDFAVVFGAAGLKSYLEVRADRALEATRHAEREAEVRRHEEDLRRREADLKERQVELERLAADLEESTQRREAEIESREAALEARVADIERQGAELGAPSRRPTATVDTSDRRPEQPEEVNTAPFSPVEVDEIAAERLPTDEEPTGGWKPGDSEVRVAKGWNGGLDDAFGEERTAEQGRVSGRPASEPGTASEDEYEALEIDPEPLVDGEIIVTDLGDDVLANEGTIERGGDGATVVGANHDLAVERWMASREPTLKTVDGAGRARLSVSAGEEVIEQVLGDRLAVRVQLHRMPTYPLICLIVGSLAALEGVPGQPPPIAFLFDVGDRGDRAVLDALADQFTFVLDLYDRQYLPIKKRSISGAFAEMVADAAAEAADALALLDPAERSFEQACAALSDPSFDRYGWKNPDRREFREDKFQALGSPRKVRRALAIARHFSAPRREDYLLWTLGYPRRLWQEGRRRVIERAIALGLWPGARLAEIAVRDGAAGSRRELITRLKRGFAALVADPILNDLDEDAVRDNWTALAREGAAVGIAADDILTSAPRSEPIRSGDDPAVSGVITGTDHRPAPEREEPARALESAELVALLDNRDRRLSAALELARRREVGAVGAVFGALLRMTRAEAVQVLGGAVAFGPPTVPYLIEGTRSRKAFLRQGCALALAVLGTEDAVEAIADALVGEPTEVWREIARAIGEVGPAAIMPLASRLRQCPKEARDRIAWALAEVASRGHTEPIEQLAGGRDPIAQEVARHALSLARTAGRETEHIRRGGRSRRTEDQTVNRAFSRDFFEALATATGRTSAFGGDPGTPAESGEVSGPHMLLDESDLIEAQEIDEL